MKLKKFPWKTILPAVADAARELLGRRNPETDLPPSGLKPEMETQIAVIKERLQILEASQVDQAVVMKRISRIALRSSIAIWLGIGAFAISSVALLLTLIR